MKRFLTLSLTSLLACGGGAEAPAPSTAAPPAEAPAVAAAPSALATASQALATLGGTVMAAGQKLIEVLPSADGSVRASLMTAQGEAIVDPQATVTVRVQGDDGQQHPVALSWDAEAGVYTGSVAAGVTLQPGPVDVSVASGGGGAVTGHVARVSVAPVATHGGSVMVAGDRGAEVRVGGDGKVEAWVAGEDGAFLDADDGAAVMVQVGADGAPTQPVTLTWSTEAGHYVGRAQGVTLTESTPVQLSLTRGQAQAQTRVAEVRVMTGAAPRTAAVQVGIRGDGKPPTVNIGNAGVSVNVAAHAPTTQVNITGGAVGVRAPGVTVSVMGGAATTQQGGSVHVQVGAPAPSVGVSVMAAAPAAPSVGVSVMAATPAPPSGMATVRVGGGGGVSIGGMAGIHIGN